MQVNNRVSLVKDANHVDVLVVENDLAKSRISLFGGHILSYQPRHDGRERLWLSRNAVMDGTKAIRGGIPVCWPWFGDHPSGDLPAHGYVRTQHWQLIDCVDSAAATEIKLRPAQPVCDGLDGIADLLLVVTIGRKLMVQLVTRNLGESSVRFSGALHSYFNVDDIRQTELLGLSGDYLDKTAGFARKTTDHDYRFHGETDRIHLGAQSPQHIQTSRFSIGVESSGHDSIVVWNPWLEKTRAMSDMHENAFQSMLCVETAVTTGVTLETGEQHTLTQIIN